MPLPMNYSISLLLAMFACEIGFQKLRKLLMATYDSLGKAIDRIGPEETKDIIEAIIEHLEKRRDSPGNFDIKTQRD
jgi:hypothetical protein